MSLALVQTACASKKNSQNTSVDTAEFVSQNKVAKSDSLLATLERGFCFGTCPVYKVEIYQSGHAVYVGKANVKMIGTFTAQLSKDQLNSLISTAKEINYMGLEDVYDNKGVTDLPTTTSSIVINKKRKVVKRRIDYPEYMLAFEEKIDEIVQNAQWKQQ